MRPLTRTVLLAGTVLLATALQPAAAQPVRLLRDINPGPASSNAGNFTTVGDEVWFVATDPAHGTELWRSNATEQGTTVAVETIPGPTSVRSLGWIRPVGNRVVFGVGTGVFTDGAWTTDKTQAGTGPLGPLASGMYPSSLGTVGDRLLFQAWPNSSGRGLWVTDGTPTGTALIRSITNESVCCYSFTWPGPTVGGVALINAYTPEAGLELWSSNGTVAGTGLLRDLNPGASGSSPLGYTRVMNGAMYFTAMGGSDSRRASLWRSDGSAAGTTLVRRFDSGSISLFPAASEVADRFYFMYSEARQQTLWVSDGTPQGTLPVQSGFFRANDDVSGLGILGVDDTGRAFLVYNPDFDAPYQLLISDGSPQSVRLVATLPDRITGSTVMGRVLVFTTSDPEHGVELWRSDGSALGTRLLVDANPGPTPSYPASFARLGNRLWLTLDDGAHGFEPWLVELPGSADCNANGIPDDLDIASGVLHDVNHDLRPDECQCLADWDGSGGPPTLDDLFGFLAAYFAGDADVSRDGTTTVQDLFEYLVLFFRGCV